MESLTLEEFEKKWSFKISSFISVTVNGEVSDVLGFSYDAGESTSKTKEELLESMNKPTAKAYYGVDNIKELSDEVLSPDLNPEASNSIKSFSCDSYGYDLKIDSSKALQLDLKEFFLEFSRISLRSFPKEICQSMPESAYVRELFSVTTISRFKDYVFYLLNFKSDTVEYKVMRDFLLMCYLFKKISGNNSTPLNTSIRRLDVDYSACILRIGMLFPRSGTPLI